MWLPSASFIFERPSFSPSALFPGDCFADALIKILVVPVCDSFNLRESSVLVFVNKRHSNDIFHGLTYKKSTTF